MWLKPRPKRLPRGFSHVAHNKLNLTLDELGIIRLDSRLRYAEYPPYDVRFPVIGTLRFTERQRDSNVLRQTVN